MIEALRWLARTLDPEQLAEVLDGARGELSRLVPELGVGPAGEPAAAALPPTRLFELLLGVLHRLAGRGPVLLVVEDLHWADQSTRDLLGFLVRNLRGGVALVLPYRSDELHRRHPLRPFLAELDRSGRVERLELGRLDRGELAELLGGILGGPVAPALVGGILARSAGNPIFAEELLAAHLEGARLAAQLEGARLPSALRDLVLARVEGPSEAAQHVLAVAAVAGARVDHELLAVVVGQDAEQPVGLLREAVTHYVLVVEGATGAYVFRHALVQEAVYDDLLPVQRAPLHAAYARALERRIEQRGDPGRATADEPYWHTELCRSGLAVEAAIAEQARAPRRRRRAGRPRAGGRPDRALPRRRRRRGHLGGAHRGGQPADRRGRVVPRHRRERSRPLGAQRGGVGRDRLSLGHRLRALAPGRGAARPRGAALGGRRSPRRRLENRKRARRPAAGRRDRRAGPQGAHRAATPFR